MYVRLCKSLFNIAQSTTYWSYESLITVINFVKSSALCFQTGLTLSHLIYHLAHNPEKQQKLYQELKAEVTTEEPIPQEVLEDGLSYLKAVVKESMRLD